MNRPTTCTASADVEHLDRVMVALEFVNRTEDMLRARELEDTFVRDRALDLRVASTALSRVLTSDNVATYGNALLSLVDLFLAAVREHHAKGGQ